ncbi:hypothetical protein [Streptomyces sp. NPDC060187]
MRVEHTLGGLLQAFVDTDASAFGIAGNWLWFRAVDLPEDREGIATLLL